LEEHSTHCVFCGSADAAWECAHLCPHSVNPALSPLSLFFRHQSTVDHPMNHVRACSKWLQVIIQHITYSVFCDASHHNRNDPIRHSNVITMALVRAHNPRQRGGDANIDIEAEPVAAPIVAFAAPNAAPAGDDLSIDAELRAIAAAPRNANQIRKTFRIERDRAERRDRDIRAEAAAALRDRETRAEAAAALRDREIHAEAAAERRDREIRADDRHQRAFAAATNDAERARADQEYTLAIANINADRARIQGRVRDDDEIPGSRFFLFLFQQLVFYVTSLGFGFDFVADGPAFFTMFLAAMFGVGCVDFTSGPKTTRLEYSLKMPREIELENGHGNGAVASCSSQVGLKVKSMFKAWRLCCFAVFRPLSILLVAYFAGMFRLDSYQSFAHSWRRGVLCNIYPFDW
jgi:hypothetical protein